jgi:8-oxo-dGTP pyrophosphatase MutT (NUDIX family)
MKRHFSAGGVIIKTERERPFVLLIKDGYGHWTWPKGHIEKGESPEDAALREITEETGLKKIGIEAKIGEQTYYFKLKGELIFKTVYIFLVKASAREKLVIQASEIADAKWLPAEDALKAIEYKGSREMVEKGIRLFREKYKSDK